MKPRRQRRIGAVGAFHSGKVTIASDDKEFRAPLYGRRFRRYRWRHSDGDRP